MTVLELPWPPSVNHYWRLGHGHFHISTEGRAYKQAVGEILARFGIRPVRDRLKITIDAFPPDRRRRDLDNLQKCILDACAVNRESVTGLYGDDSQIKRLEETMHDFAPERAGRVILTRTSWDDSRASPASDRCPLCGAERPPPTVPEGGSP